MRSIEGQGEQPLVKEPSTSQHVQAPTHEDDSEWENVGPAPKSYQEFMESYELGPYAAKYREASGILWDNMPKDPAWKSIQRSWSTWLSFVHICGPPLWAPRVPTPE
eukprot:TRINITY_DN17368_c0_g1_i1.p1 TRINITY_DN17368_c0_g1~~TRINITY_DN17368_c0_g1_i1.p1  ORF type:complete len:107 (+),score=8.10 TRINITY_DN17368_c0_g1_i1:579-899(+)